MNLVKQFEMFLNFQTNMHYSYSICFHANPQPEFNTNLTQKLAGERGAAVVNTFRVHSVNSFFEYSLRLGQHIR